MWRGSTIDPFMHAVRGGAVQVVADRRIRRPKCGSWRFVAARRLLYFQTFLLQMADVTAAALLEIPNRALFKASEV